MEYLTEGTGECKVVSISDQENWHSTGSYSGSTHVHSCQHEAVGGCNLSLRTVEAQITRLSVMYMYLSCNVR